MHLKNPVNVLVPHLGIPMFKIGRGRRDVRLCDDERKAFCLVIAFWTMASVFFVSGIIQDGTITPSSEVTRAVVFFLETMFFRKSSPASNIAFSHGVGSDWFPLPQSTAAVAAATLPRPGMALLLLISLKSCATRERLITRIQSITNTIIQHLELYPDTAAGRGIIVGDCCVR